MRRFPALLLLLFLALSGLIACDRKEAPGGGKATIATDFTLLDLDGQPVTLSDYRGKIVFLNFWATWCPPCRAEIPSMERLNEVLGQKDFVMLAINVDSDLKTLTEFVEKNSHAFTVLSDADRTVQNLYQVDKFPETFVIGKDGRILDHIVGSRDWSSNEALQYFTKLVEGP